MHSRQQFVCGRGPCLSARAVLVAEPGQPAVGVQPVGVDDRPRGRSLKSSRLIATNRRIRREIFDQTRYMPERQGALTWLMLMILTLGFSANWFRFWNRALINP